MMMVMAWTTAPGEHGSPSLVSIASGCGVTIGILESGQWPASRSRWSAQPRWPLHGADLMDPLNWVPWGFP